MLEKFRHFKNSKDKRITRTIAVLNPDSEYNKKRTAKEEEDRVIRLMERIRESNVEYYDITFDEYSSLADYMAKHWRYLGVEADKTGCEYPTFFGKKLRPRL